MLEYLAGNNTLATIVAFGLVLIPAIIVHEAGHFLAAKAAGIAILEFGIGFPPRALTLGRRGETEYTLNWLPVGGFVRPLGETFVRHRNRSELEGERLRLLRDAGKDGAATGRLLSVNEAAPLARIMFMAAGSAANLLTATILFTIIGLTGLPTIVGGSATVVAVAGEGQSLPAGLRASDRITTVDGEYFADVRALLTLLQSRSGNTVSLERERDGAVEELVWLVPELSFSSQVYVLQVAGASPAEDAGILPGDLIVALNDQPFEQFSDLQDMSRAQRGASLTLTLQRGGEQLQVELKPRLNPPEGEGAIGIGVVPAWGAAGLVLTEGGWQQGITQLALPEALRFSIEQLLLFVRTLVNLPGQLLAGSLRPEETRLMSPLAISQVGGRFLQDSIEHNQPYVILSFIALISIALGITNLLPLPALDGGRILFVLVELVRGRPVAPEREGLVHLFGMALLLSLMLITFVNDLMNPVTLLLP